MVFDLPMPPRTGHQPGRARLELHVRFEAKTGPSAGACRGVTIPSPRQFSDAAGRAGKLLEGVRTFVVVRWAVRTETWNLTDGFDLAGLNWVPASAQDGWVDGPQREENLR
jgi:hypothetical protein